MTVIEQDAATPSAAEGAAVAGSGDTIAALPGAEATGPAAAAATRKPINLALQGGGSHGAFTWGVLDRLIEDGRLSFEGVSGASAGAMNGAVFTCGFAKGGPEQARELLATFWQRVSRDSWLSPFQPTLWNRVTGDPNLYHSPLYHVFDLTTRLVSPYQINPFNYNPLRRLLRDMIDFDLLRASKFPRLYVSTTNVLTGRLKLFAGSELSMESLLASACLPQLFQAVEVNGKYYWDGGYMGNPTLFPLVHQCDSQDVVVIQINPLTRADVPKTSAAILDRLNEISFNSTFVRELLSLRLVNRLLENKLLKEDETRMRPVFLHMIGAETAMRRLDVSSKLNTDWTFLRELHALGREAADRWLNKYFAALGQYSTFGMEGEEVGPE